MNKYVVLSLLLIVTCVSMGQLGPDRENQQKSIPDLAAKVRKAAESNHVGAFADAFKDPNVLIGVFELPEVSTESVPATIMSSGKTLEKLTGYWEARSRFSQLRRLNHVTSINGKFAEPVVFVILPPIMRRLYGPPVPPFIPPRQSKWVLALEKTSREERIAQFGKEIEKYEFLNDRTVFGLFRYGRGALCLKWPEKVKEPEWVVKFQRT